MSKYTDEQIQQALTLFRSAMEHQLKAWDHLHGVEQILNEDIDDQEFTGLAVGINTPGEVAEVVTIEDLMRTINVRK